MRCAGCFAIGMIANQNIISPVMREKEIHRMPAIRFERKKPIGGCHFRMQV